MRVVVVDDEPATCGFLRAAFNAEGHVCESFLRAEDAEQYFAGHAADLVLVDVYLGAANGLDLIDRIRALCPRIYPVIMTAHISVETAARSVTQGAIEYVAKPLTLDQIHAITQRAQEFCTRDAVEMLPAPTEHFKTSIIGRSPKMLEIYTAIGRVAPSNVSVLITGASGTGKELVARAIHEHSPRAAKPFIAVNCGSLTETLLESELFGHEKGAFTGAEATRQGVFEATNGGTLFLDEVAETTLAFQVKLLRVLQEQQIRRVGSTRQIPVDVRILAASNRNLPDLLRQRAFREDLYYRLSVVQISVPSLEERREDIPLLLSAFLQEFNRANGRSVSLDAAAVRHLRELPWPGNVRELENAVKRLAIFARGGRITVSDVDELRAGGAPEPASQPAMPSSDRLQELERQHIVRVLSEAKGNKAEAARRLGIERKTLYKKALRLGIDLQLQEKR